MVQQQEQLVGLKHTIPVSIDLPEAGLAGMTTSTLHTFVECIFVVLYIDHPEFYQGVAVVKAMTIPVLDCKATSTPLGCHVVLLSRLLSCLPRALRFWSALLGPCDWTSHCRRPPMRTTKSGDPEFLKFKREPPSQALLWSTHRGMRHQCVFVVARESRRPTTG